MTIPLVYCFCLLFIQLWYPTVSADHCTAAHLHKVKLPLHTDYVAN